MLNNELKSGIEKININKLNDCIEANRRNMVPSINYDFLEKSSRLMLQRINLGNEKQIVPIILFSREEAISIVLKFFHSLGNTQWYEKAKGIILGQNKKIGINIFREEDIQDLSEKNEDGFYKYSNGSEVEYKLNGSRALIRILLNDEFEDVKNCIPNDKFTIQDVYDIVHEISHTFDLGNTKRSIEVRRLFAEITPYCFEKNLGDYLIHNNILSEKVANKIAQRRTECSIRHARAVCTKINLVRLKEKEGILNKDNIKKMLEQNGIHSPLYVQSMFSDVLNSVPNIDFDAKYAIAELAAHQYMRKYKNDKTEALERLNMYCEAVKTGNWGEETFELIGCPIDEEEVEKIVNDIRDDKNR